MIKTLENLGGGCLQVANDFVVGHVDQGKICLGELPHPILGGVERRGNEDIALLRAAGVGGRQRELDHERSQDTLTR